MAMKPIRLNTSDAQKAHSERGAMGWTLEKRPEGLAPVVVACYSKGKTFAHLVKFGRYFELRQAARPKE